MSLYLKMMFLALRNVFDVTNFYNFLLGSRNPDELHKLVGIHMDIDDSLVIWEYIF